MKGANRLVVFADMFGRENMVDRIKEKLLDVQNVQKVDAHGPLFDGMTLDIWTHPIIAGIHRGIVLIEHIYRGLFKLGWSEIGSAYGPFLVVTGTNSGAEFYRGISKLAPREMQPRLAAELMRLLGFGVFKWVKLNERSAVVDVKDSFECELYRNDGQERSSGYFLLGFLRGWLSGYWDTDPSEVRGLETMCIAKGDPHCRYEFTREK